ncbi:MAG: hypothetical protein ACRD4C_04465, partial [Candidatus Acidiferrales bacterium]
MESRRVERVGLLGPIAGGADRPTFARRADAAGAEQTAQGFSAEREALCFNELFVEMMIVETGVARACQS